MDEYGYRTAEPSRTADYVWPTVFTVLDQKLSGDDRVFDLGCGNGAFAAALEKRGYDVTGVAPSSEGIQQGREEYPELDIHVGSARGTSFYIGSEVMGAILKNLDERSRGLLLQVRKHWLIPT